MILREEILKEHSSAQAMKIAAYACASKKNFSALMKCFLDEERRVAQRAAWSVSRAAYQKPAMIMPHLKDLVSVLHKKNVHDAVTRNAVKVLSEIEIPEALHGEVMDACFRFIEKPSTPVAVKVFSLSVLFNLSKKYPDIRPELKILIEDRWPQETAAFRARAKKIVPHL